MSTLVSKVEATQCLHELGDLLSQSTPILQAFDTVAQRQTNPALSQLVLHLRTGIKQGDMIASAMATYPEIFSLKAMQEVQQGEVNGTLDIVFRDIALT